MLRRRSLALSLLALVGLGSLLSGPALADEVAVDVLAGPGAVDEFSLADALALLDRQNPTLGQARARAETARARSRMAAVPLLPVIAASGSYTRNNADATVSLGGLFDGIEQAINAALPAPVTLDRSGIPGDLIIQPLEQLSGGVQARVALFAGNAYADLAAALQGVQAADAGVEAAQAKLRAALGRAAWLSAAADGFVEASEHAAQTASEHVAMVQRGLNAGIFPRLYLLEAQANLAARQADAVKARAARDNALLAQGALLGRSGPVRIRVPLGSVEPGLGTGPALPDAPPDDRPELRALKASLRATDAQRASAWLRHAPTLGVSFAALASDVAFPTGETTAWRVSLDLNWVAFDGGFRYAKLAEARAARQEARWALRDEQIKETRALRDARRGIKVAEEWLRASRVQRDTAREAADAAERALKAGTGRSIDALDAEQRATLTEVAEIDARARLAVARIDLRSALGLSVEDAEDQ